MSETDGDSEGAKPEPQIRLVIGAALSELAAASAQVQSFLQSHGVEKRGIFALETALEELVTNALNYAFRPNEAQVIAIEARAGPEQATVLVEYAGAAFDPTGAPIPNVNRSLEEMPVGGLGIHLIRELSDGFAYERENDRNRVRVWVARRK